MASEAQIAKARENHKPAVPQRQSTEIKKSDVVQGKGSWVKWRKLTFGESKQVATDRQNFKDDPEKIAEQTQAIFSDHVLDWNWVYDDGSPMPIPAADASVFDQLNDDEIGFLASFLSFKTDPKS